MTNKNNKIQKEITHNDGNGGKNKSNTYLVNHSSS
jgi:hypothetical protein